jgi:hypothetical protein
MVPLAVGALVVVLCAILSLLSLASHHVALMIFRFVFPGAQHALHHPRPTALRDVMSPSTAAFTESVWSGVIHA